ncbi:hypothetical protein V5799_005033 [Amblyomma americanum]|uniref:Uncharacterized protein n=1 Tax=Amblyomma americanum TaxID=6943 RepID=A0AAQ4D4E5_AMBAM
MTVHRRRFPLDGAATPGMTNITTIQSACILIPTSITTSHMVHSPHIKDPSIQFFTCGLGCSDDDTMLRNPLSFAVQVFLELLHSAHDGSPPATRAHYFPPDGAATPAMSKITTIQSACILIPTMITTSHMVHSPNIKNPSIQFFTWGLGCSNEGTMLRNPLCFAVQVFLELIHAAHVGFPPATRAHYFPPDGAGTPAMTTITTIEDTFILMPTSITTSHMFHSPDIKGPSIQFFTCVLCCSNVGTMIRNPLSFAVQVFLELLHGAHDGSPPATRAHYFPLDGAATPAKTNSTTIQSACILIPTSITASPMVHSPDNRDPSIQFFTCGPGCSNDGTMLKKPLCFAVEVFLELLRAAHDGSPPATRAQYFPPDGAATPAMTNITANQGACILIPTSITTSHMVHSPDIKDTSIQLFTCVLGCSNEGTMLRNPICFAVQVFLGFLHPAHDGSPPAYSPCALSSPYALHYCGRRRNNGHDQYHHHPKRLHLDTDIDYDISHGSFAGYIGPINPVLHLWARLQQ